MKQTETIAAIATALSDSGIGIIRISGSEAISVGDRVYRSKNGCHSLKDYGSHTIHYGFIMDGQEILDEVMVTVMKAPKTYTREDVVEINLPRRRSGDAPDSGKAVLKTEPGLRSRASLPDGPF